MSTLTVGTISEKVTDAGVAVDGVTLKDGGAVFTSAVTATDNTVDLGASSTRFKDIYLSGGAFLGGTGSANKLTDYEEGTWTPFIQASVSNPTVGYAVQNGVYVKVGQLVLASANMEINSFSGGSGNTEVGGLPFASSATSMFSPHAVLLDNLANDRKQVTVQLANNGTVANLLGNSGGTGTHTGIVPSDFGGNEHCRITFIYRSQ